jgi:6-phosphogluconolactonase
MKSISVQRFADPEAVCAQAAALFEREAAAAVRSGRRFRVALSGGSTPRSLFELLAAPAFRDRIDWSAVDFCWGDERAVSPEDLQSNYGMARETLLDALELSDRQVHRMIGEAPDLPAAAGAYQQDLAALFGVPAEGVPPAFDLVLLGLGDDGHTASLFPYTSALDESERWVVANPVPKLGTTRLTLTPGILNRARRTVFLVVGASKADALAAVVEGPQDAQQFPAQLIAPREGELLWLADEAAAFKLSKAVVSANLL